MLKGREVVIEIENCAHNLHVPGGCPLLHPAAPCCTPPPPLDSSYRRHTTDMALDDYAAKVGGSLDALTRRFNSGERSNR